jgi:tRNA-splicing ligase RtcB
MGEVSKKQPEVVDERADIDMGPMVYKDIDEVMAAQADLVESLARFRPSLVKMAGAGERPED